MSLDWFNFWMNFVLSCISLGVSITAIILTCKQINLSNKQVLFDRRLNIYSLLLKLLANQNILKNYYILEHLNNNDYLQIFNRLIKFDKELYTNIKFEDIDNYKSFIFEKINLLRNKSLEIHAIFNKEYSIILKEYINVYANIIDGLYNHFILIEETNNMFERGIIDDKEYNFEINDLNKHWKIREYFDKFDIYNKKIYEYKILDKISETLDLGGIVNE